MKMFACGLALVVTLPFAELFGGCSPAAAITACHAAFRAAGPYIRGSEVWDDLHVWCDPTPARHNVSAQVEYRPFDTYDRYGRSTVTDRLPDATGFTVSPHFSCVGLAGWYRATATVRATGADGQTNTVMLVGGERHVTAAECIGGTGP